MALRDLLWVGIIGAAGFVAYEIFTGNNPLANLSPPVGTDTGVDPVSTPQTGFLGVLARIESGGNYNAKNPNSSASGAFQFIKSTAQALGLPWGNDPSLPFGGAVVSVADQNEAAQTLTDQNASILTRAGVALSNATLYAAHFLGPSVAVKVLAAPASAALAPLVGQSVMTANKFPSTWTVANFNSWLQGKVG